MVLSQSTCLGYGFGPVHRSGNQLMFLSLSFALPSPLFKNFFRVKIKIKKKSYYCSFQKLKEQKYFTQETPLLHQRFHTYELVSVLFLLPKIKIHMFSPLFLSLPFYSYLWRDRTPSEHSVLIVQCAHKQMKGAYCSMRVFSETNYSFSKIVSH